MANIDSSKIANVKTGVLNDVRSDGGRLRIKFAKVDVTSGESSGSTYRFFRLPSDAVVYKIWKTGTGTTGWGNNDLGVYEMNDGPVVSVDILMDGEPMTASSVNALQRSGKGNGFAHNWYQLQLWERMGLASDPRVEWDVTLTSNDAAGSTGEVGFQIEFTNGS